MAAIKNMISRLTSGGIVDPTDSGNTNTSATTASPVVTTASPVVTTPSTSSTNAPDNSNYTPCAAGTYRIIKDSITVSGISSGGSMATQLHAGKNYLIDSKYFFFI